MVRLSAAVAITPSGGIGNNGTLPWASSGVKLMKDLKYFKEITTQTKNENGINAVIMGRKTFESIPTKFKPLSNRINIVITRNTHWTYENVLVASSLDSAINIIESHEKSSQIEKAIVIGGVKLFEETLHHKLCDEYHITEVDIEFLSDTFLSVETLEYIHNLNPISTSDTFIDNNVSYR